MATTKTHLWNNNGTKQSNRLPKALSGDYVKIDERSFDDLLAQMAEYAKRLVYYDDNMKPSGDWHEFFEDVYDYDKQELKKEHIEALTEAGDMPPHLALIMAFLKMYQVEQANLNTLTDKHLQFYYKDILGFRPCQGENGKATVFFEPVKNVSEVFIPKGTQFDAGKDANGKPITYRSVRDVTVNQIKVIKNEQLLKEDSEQPPFKIIFSSPNLIPVDGVVKLYNCNDVEIDTSHLNLYIKDGEVIIETTNKFDDLKKVMRIDHFSINVKGSKNFIIENAMGTVANQTGSMPFGAQPQKGDSFTIVTPQDNISIDKASIEMNNYSYSDSDREGAEIILKTDLDWSTYTKGLKAYINALNEDSSEATLMPQPPKAPSLKSPITIDYTLCVKEPQALFYSPYGNSPISIETEEYKEIVIKELDLITKPQLLFLKLECIQVTGVFSLHFEMNPFKYLLDGKYGENTPRWYYHNLEGWVPFPDTDIISDTTDRFKRSGIIQIKINNDIVSSAIDEKNGLWLMVDANTTDNPFEALEAVRPQAVDVELDPYSEGALGTGTALPANTIAKAKTSIKGIKKIEQPYSGEEGRKDETDEKFYVRVSEKLRHKGRAWNRWDYERLVLERFPQIANVKCLSGCDKDGNLKAGCITLLVIPDGQAIHQVNPLKPIIGQTLKDEITSYLKKRASDFIEIYVVTPTYVEAKVTCTLTLREGYTDTNHYSMLLNEQLKQFLAPWSSENEGVEFRTNKNESQIEEFIENQYYVDYIESFSLSIQHFFDDTVVNIPVKQGESLQPDNVLSIITSAEQHKIIFNLSEQ